MNEAQLSYITDPETGLLASIKPFLGSVSRVRLPRLVAELTETNEELMELERSPYFYAGSMPKDWDEDQQRNAMTLNSDYDYLASAKESLQHKITSIIQKSSLPNEVMECKQRLPLALFVALEGAFEDKTEGNMRLFMQPEDAELYLRQLSERLLRLSQREQGAERA